VQDIILRVSRVSVTDHDGNLLDLGVKSIDMLRIVAMLERDFAIEFAVAELTRHNFTSVRAICALIQRTPRAA
jgi:acyl carrier protein